MAERFYLASGPAECPLWLLALGLDWCRWTPNRWQAMPLEGFRRANEVIRQLHGIRKGHGLPALKVWLEPVMGRSAA